MSLLDNIRALLPSQAKNANKQPDFLVTSISPTRYYAEAVDSEDYLDNFNLWTYKAIKTKADSIIQYNPELVVDKDTEEGEVIKEEIKKKDSQLLQDLQYFNPYFTYSDARWYRVVQQELTGAAYWYLTASSTSGHKVEFYPLDPNRVFLNTDTYGLPKEYIFRDVDGKEHYIEPDRIIVFKDPHPRNWLRALGTLEASRYAHNALELAFKHNMNTFGNRGVPEGFLSFEGIDEKDRERIEKQLKQKYSGVKNAGRTGVINHPLEYIRVGDNNKDLEFVEGTKLLRDTILSIHGVPKTLVGIEDATYRNAIEAIRVYQRYTLKPMLQKEASVLNEQVIPKYHKFVKSLSKIQYYFDAPDPVEADSAAIAAENALLFEKGIITRNEARVAVGQAAINGQDIFANQTAPVAAEPEDIEEDVENDMENMNSDSKSLKMMIKSLDREGLRDYYHVKSVTQEDGLIELMQGFWNGEMLRILDVAQKYTKPTLKIEPKWSEENEILIGKANPFLQGVAAGYSQDAMDIVGKKSLSADLKTKLVDTIPETVAANVNKFFKKINADTKADLIKVLSNAINNDLGIDATKMAIADLFTGYIEGKQNIEALKKADVYIERVEQSIDGNVVVSSGNRYNAMFEKITQILKGAEQTAALQHLLGAIDLSDPIGKSTYNLIKNIYGLSPIDVMEMPAGRAATIARTEINRAKSVAQRRTYFSSNSVKSTSWLSARDADTRHAHALADGQKRPRGAKFLVGGEYLEYPCDPRGRADNTINCRCTLLPELD